MKITKPIKERLNAHLEMLARLEALKKELAFAAEYSTMKSPNLTGMPSGGGYKGTSETEVAVIRKIELEEKVSRKEAEIEADWAELAPSIEALKPIETLVMRLRYYYGGEWSEVCAAVYGKRKDYESELERYMNSVFKIHGRALLSLAEMPGSSEGVPQEV